MDETRDHGRVETPAIGRRGVLAGAGAVVFGGCSTPRSSDDAATENDATIDAPDAVALDERFALSAAGVGADPVRIEAVTEFGEGDKWAAHATFEPADGRVDVAEQAPVDGTYESADPMGLFWSMEPRGETGGFLRETQDLTIRVRDSDVDGGAETDPDATDPLAETTITRHLLPPGSEETHLEEPIVGTVVEAPDERPAPGIVLFHGSGGNRPVTRARALAGHGFSVLALQYFGERWDEVPDALVEVPLEYVREAIEWFREHEAVSDAPIGLGGVSRGGELAMEMATRVDDVGAVVNWVGAGVLVAALSQGTRRPGTGAWSVDGDPLPYVPHTSFSTLDDERVDEASVDLEAIEAPILLISAGSDEVWPSRYLLNRTESRLDALEYDYEYEHLSYDDAGHSIGVPYLPTYRRPLRHRQATATASADSWPTVLEYFERGAER